jgi:hypothetical protein
MRFFIFLFLFCELGIQGSSLLDAKIPGRRRQRPTDFTNRRRIDLALPDKVFDSHLQAWLGHKDLQRGPDFLDAKRGDRAHEATPAIWMIHHFHFPFRRSLMLSMTGVAGFMAHSHMLN